MTAIDKLRQDAAGLLPQGERAIYNRTQLEAILAEVDALVRERDALFVLTDRLTAEHDALRAERDEVRQSYCSLMEAYRGGDGRVTANKLGWGYLFEEDKPCQ